MRLERGDYNASADTASRTCVKNVELRTVYISFVGARRTLAAPRPADEFPPGTVAVSFHSVAAARVSPSCDCSHCNIGIEVATGRDPLGGHHAPIHGSVPRDRFLGP